MEYRRRANLRTALIWFSVQNNVSQSLVPQDTQIGVYRALLPPGVNDPSTFMPALRSVQISSDPFDAENPQERKITLLMVAGGHFAGMVVSLKPLSLTHGKGKKPERQDVKGAGDMRILQHKTFHRYTSRSIPLWYVLCHVLIIAAIQRERNKEVHKLSTTMQSRKLSLPEPCYVDTANSPCKKKFNVS